MTAVSHRSFSSGEISPTLYSRVDTIRYATGLKTCRNWIINTDGSASVRPGTEYLVPVLDFGSTADTNVRLVPFYKDESTNYVLVFMSNRLYFMKNGAYILDSTDPIVSLTAADPGVFEVTSHGFSNNDFVYLTNIVGPDSLNNQYYRVLNVTTDTFTLTTVGTDDVTEPVNTSALPVFVSGSVARVNQLLTTTIFGSELPFLRYAQNGAVLSMVTGAGAYNLTNASDTSWFLSSSAFDPTGPSLSTPATPSYTSYTSGADQVVSYAVTAVTENGEESFVSNSSPQQSVSGPSLVNPVNIDWAPTSGAEYYYVYRDFGGAYGLVGRVDQSDFEDIGYEPDFSITPPLTKTIYNFLDYPPRGIAYHQQRLMLGGSDDFPQSIFGSRPSFPFNFTFSVPSQPGDSIEFTISSFKKSQALHLLSADDFYVFTPNAEYLIGGDSANILRPAAINSRQISSFGASPYVAPMLVGSSPIFVQASSGRVFELDYLRRSSTSGGIDLNIFSGHLVEKYTIADWTYQLIPQSTIWLARSDGVLLACTYDKDQNVVAWSRHETDGVIQNAVTLPEGVAGFGSGNTFPPALDAAQDELYLTVAREIDGNHVRYIEKMAPRQFDEISDYIGMDSTLSFDGTNTGSIVLGIAATGGPETFEDGEVLQIQASAPLFTGDEVGNEYHIISEDGTKVIFRVQSYATNAALNGMVDRLVPVDLRTAFYGGTGTTDWGYAVDTFSGLQHLEGKEVSVLGDGYVVASPNNSQYEVLTVTNGEVTLPACYVKVHIGLPFLADLETLDIDTPDGESLINTKITCTSVTLNLVNSRGLFVGANFPTGDDPLENLYEMKMESYEQYPDPLPLYTGKSDVVIASDWNSSGRVAIRQVDPIPATVGGITPEILTSRGA